jgi:hypothetical protein
MSPIIKKAPQLAAQKVEPTAVQIPKIKRRSKLKAKLKY